MKTVQFFVKKPDRFQCLKQFYLSKQGRIVGGHTNDFESNDEA